MSKRIVVRGPRWLGDHVMALPFYRGLRAAYPDDHVCLVISEALQELGYPDCFNQVLTFSTIEGRGWKGSRALARRLKAECFDLSFSLPASYSAALPFFLARVRYRLGFDQSGSSLLLTDSLRWASNRSGKHKSRLYLDLLELATGKPVEMRLPPLSVGTSKEKLIVVAPGASISLRQWPYHQEFLPRLSARYPDYRIVVVGSANESAWGELVSDLGQRQIENAVGKTSLTELRSLVGQAALVIANDSGVAHIAGTLAEAPTLVIFGPGDPSYITPLGPRIYAVRAESLKCSPCEKPYCRAPYGYQACLLNLSAGDVLAKVVSILG